MLLHIGKHVLLIPFRERIGVSLVDIVPILIGLEHKVAVHPVGFLHSEEDILDAILLLERGHHVRELEQLHLGAGDAVEATPEDV